MHLRQTARQRALQEQQLHDDGSRARQHQPRRTQPAHEHQAQHEVHREVDERHPHRRSGVLDRVECAHGQVDDREKRHADHEQGEQHGHGVGVGRGELAVPEEQPDDRLAEQRQPDRRRHVDHQNQPHALAVILRHRRKPALDGMACNHRIHHRRDRDGEHADGQFHDPVGQKEQRGRRIIDLICQQIDDVDVHLVDRRAE